MPGAGFHAELLCLSCLPVSNPASPASLARHLGRAVPPGPRGIPDPAQAGQGATAADEGVRPTLCRTTLTLPESETSRKKEAGQ